MMNLLNITAGAQKMLEIDPHGWTLTIVAVGVVFSCLLILFGVYSLSGYIFKKSAGKQSAKEVRQQPDPENPLRCAKVPPFRCASWSPLLWCRGWHRFSRSAAAGPSAKNSTKDESELAAAIGASLYMSESGETEAAISLALHMYLSECAHDVEPGVITIQGYDSPWAAKERNFRLLPSKRQ